MKYHTISEHDDVMELKLNKEARWLELTKKAVRREWYTNEEIRRTLSDIQEYVNCDFPIEEHSCDRDILDAFELVCRVAYSLAEKSESMDRRYITNKLYASLKYLALDKSDFES